VGAAHLADFEELDAPPAVADVVPAGSLLANARCVVALDARLDADARAWTCDGRVAAVRLAADLPVSELRDGARALEALVDADAARAAAPIRGRWAHEVWDLVAQLGPQLADDLAILGPQLAVEGAHPGVVLGDGPVWIERGAIVEPYVVFDTTAGPVLVRRGATVQAFTRVGGPCYIGEHSIVGVDRISGCSIGDTCRVHGEMSASIMLGHANKAHDGFVGHSYLGRWANLGAGTTTSNLKNTYGTVALWTPAGVRDTGMQFLGTLFGDHAKSGIGLQLSTGSLVGAGANVYDRMPPKAVPPFAWGGGAPYDTYDAERFVKVAARAMARRQITLGERGRRQLLAAHAARWTP
jgi:UDP-N-acetylglucosamine diphosphorylase/glucosamine-1-phosphate N-acetyltransferase